MTVQLTCEQVWEALGKELFAVLGMVTAQGESRTVGIVYTVHEHKLYFVTDKNTWKARHIRQNPHVSITVAIPKRIPFLPWIKIPSATITFSGLATILDPDQVDQVLINLLLRGLKLDDRARATICVIEIQPVGDFITYGVGIPLSTMRFPERARGRVPAT